MRRDWPTVLISLFAAIFASAIALFVVSRKKMGALRALVGSLFMGGGIATMHYTGMAAMRMAAMCYWSTSLRRRSVTRAVARWTGMTEAMIKPLGLNIRELVPVMNEHLARARASGNQASGPSRKSRKRGNQVRIIYNIQAFAVVGENAMIARYWYCLVFLTAGAFAARAETAPYHQTDFPPEEFKARWEVLFNKIGNQAVAVVQGAPRTNGFIFPRQTNEFYYLCGIETPGSYLLLDGRSRKATLYLPARDARLEAAEGKVLSAGDADLVKSLIGADEVLSTEAMREGWLRTSKGEAPHEIYALFSPAEGAEQSRYELTDSNAAIAADYWDARIPREARLVELLRTRFWRSQVKDLTPIFDEMRSVKSPREIALLRRSAQIAGHGLLEAMRSTRPGIYEYQLEAAARYVYLMNGARLEGYRSIIAAGVENIWNMHYYRNSKQIAQDDLILMDYAPDYHNYVSDITRMWPASGKFSATDRELLGFVLAYRNAVMQRIRPGVTPAQIQEEAKVAMQPVLARTKFSKPIYEQAAHRLVDTGGGIFSHPVGMAVHDDGEYVNGRLAPGQVFSIDPQLRVPEESRYLRYEDVIVITSNGYENFTDFLPTELSDLEKLIGQGGVLQEFPAVIQN